MKKIIVIALISIVLIQPIYAVDYCAAFLVGEAYMPGPMDFMSSCFEDHRLVDANNIADLLFSAEEILREFFDVYHHGNYLSMNEPFTGKVENIYSEEEFFEGTVKVKLTEEKAVMAACHDSFVSINRRYLWKDGSYQLSTIDVILDFGEDGIYYQEDNTEKTVDNNIERLIFENILMGYVQLKLYHPENTEVPVYYLKNPYVQHGDYFTITTSFYDTTMKIVTNIDPEVRFYSPDSWFGVVEFYREVNFDAVDAEHSLTGDKIETGDYKNYQAVHMLYKMKIIDPDVEEYKSPQTGADVFAYAAVAVVALVTAVVLKKRRRRA